MPYPLAPADGAYHVEAGVRRRYVAANTTWIIDHPGDDVATGALQAEAGAEMRGWEYTKFATVAAMNLVTGRPGEICTVTATGVDYQWNQTLTAWVPWHNNGTVLRQNITGAATVNVARRSAVEATLTGNVTGLTITGWDTDTTITQRVRFQVKQDATGGRTINWATIAGNWVESLPATYDRTSGATSFQFYAITTDGGTTVWLEPIGIAYSTDCVTAQVIEADVPAVAALGTVTINHSFTIIGSVDLVEIATGRRWLADWHQDGGAASAAVEIDFTNAFPAGTYKVRVTGMASSPCPLTVTADSEWQSIQLAVTSATNLNPRIDYTGGAAGSVQWIWGDGTAPVNVVSGTPTAKAYGSAFTGNATLRWKRNATVTRFEIAAQPAWTFDLARLRSLPGLTQLRANGTGVVGSLTSIASMTGMTSIVLSNTAVSGNLVSLSGMTGLTNLQMSSTSVGGDISAIAGNTALVFIWLFNSNVGGDISSLTAMANLANVQIYGVTNTLSGDVSVFANKPVGTVDLHGTEVSGNLSSFATRNTLTLLSLANTQVAGDPSVSLASLPSIQTFRGNGSQMTGDPNGFVTATVGTLKTFEWYSMPSALTVAEKNSILSTLAGGTLTAGAVNISGAPAATDNAAVTALQGRGWIVTI